MHIQSQSFFMVNTPNSDEVLHQLEYDITASFLRSWMIGVTERYETNPLSIKLVYRWTCTKHKKASLQ